MSHKTLWGIIAALGIACLAEGLYIYTQKKERKAAPQPWDDFGKWSQEVRKNLPLGSPIPFRQFDRLFNDKFFSHRFDPFEQMENFPKRFGHLFEEEERSLLGRSWRDWFQNRMDVTDIRPEVKSTADEVIVSLKIPGLEGESLNIDINKDRIRISYSAKTLQEKKDEKGGFYGKSESVRQYEKVMPIPDGADPGQSRTVKEGDTIKIIFKKRKPGESASP